MQRSRRMDRIVWVAAQAEREEAERLLRNRRELDELTQKIEQLQSSRKEYMTRLGSGAAMSAVQMRELRRFIEKLDVAIRHLVHQMALKSQLDAQYQEAWIGRKRRTEALDGVAGRYRREEARAAESRAQREIEDRRLVRGAEQ
ncbi:MAG: flagellar export protein FliJ [Chromatiales bacterium]